MEMQCENIIKASDKIAEWLEEQGITHAFGIIGAGNVHLYEAISRRGYTEIVCVHHEQAATMAMQTYYRTSGKLAVALLTTGGGSTNAITGVVSAWADSIPGIVIAGNENLKFCGAENPLRMWGVQGYDSIQMVEKVTKYATRVTDPKQVLYELDRAMFEAFDSRPGPVWIEVPMNLQSSRIEDDKFYRFKPEKAGLSQLEDEILPVISNITDAQRPVIWIGHGVRLSNAVRKINDLCDLLEIPVILSWAGADIVPSDKEYVVGRAGVYGQRAANFALQNSDYVLAIGTRLAIPQIGYDINELARDAKLDVVDIDITECEKLGNRTSNAICADASEFIDLMLQNIGKLTLAIEPWQKKCKQYKADYPYVDIEHEDKDGFMNSYKFMEHLNQKLSKDQIIVTDMGTALLSGHQVLQFTENQRIMTSTGLGEMGYGLPGAIGASFASNKGEILCLNCDGGIMMNLQELQTIVHHQLPIKIIIFNNDGYLMIKHTQKSLFSGSQYVGTNKSSGVSCPDFSKIAFGFGFPFFKIEDWEKCDFTLEQIMSHEGPLICEVMMHPEQVFSPKLSVAAAMDGSLVSPPLEDLSPLISMKDLEKAMVTSILEKSTEIRIKS